METLKESVVIITGGSSGIGRATAFSFASKGARVLVTGRRAASLAEAVKDHPNIETLVADTGEPEDGSRTIARAIELWGRLDVLVNNAGAGAIMPLADATAKRIIDIFAVNVLGPSLLAKEALPYLKTTKGLNHQYLEHLWLEGRGCTLALWRKQSCTRIPNSQLGFGTGAHQNPRERGGSRPNRDGSA
jgi:NAD(P)-dependent dehydrogenase (short-subunit alcohol dehydrogenase family)